jgi:hypothetical protein
VIHRQVRRRLALLRHAEEVTGNVAQTCRYYGINRQCYYTWLRRFEAEGPEGLWSVPDFIDTDLGCQVGEFPES